MPVFPLVGSRSSRPGSSSPEASAASIIAFAIRSLSDPVGFWPSSFAKTRTEGFGERRPSSTSGVCPTKSRSGEPVLATRHGRQQDEGRAVRDRRLETLARSDVLTLHEDVHEPGDLAVLEDAVAELRIA